MKICIWVALFMSVAAPAWAEWKKFGEDESAVLYFDVASIRKSGDTRRMWELVDLKAQVQFSDPGRSSLMLFEIDCKAQRLRVLAVNSYSQQMAQGKSLARPDDDVPGKWMYVAPGTNGEIQLRVACAQ
jgi:hypothetical protein